jgi:hypothetical protein
VLSPAPIPTPTSSPAADGWPYAAVSEPVFAPDGTVYVLAGARDAEDEYQQSLVALDGAGHVQPGWPIEEPAGSDFGSPTIGPDGSVYIEECGGPEAGCMLHRLGVDGEELPGWPIKVRVVSACPTGEYCVSVLVIGSDGTAYLINRDLTGNQTQVTAIDPSGDIKPGWPVLLDDQGGLTSHPQLTTDGSLFIFTRPSGVENVARLSAFDADGRPRAGWPISVPDLGGFRLGPHGTVVIVAYEPLVDPSQGGLCSDATRTVFTVLGPDGRTLPGWPRGSKGLASGPVIDDAQTVYYLSAVGNLYAHDLEGDVKAGWPVSVPGVFPGCGGYGPYLGPDGTVYALGEEVVASTPDGNVWRYRPDGGLAGSSCDTDSRNQPAPALGADGTTYVATFGSASDAEAVEVAALDSQGRVKPGWPFRVPIDGRTSDVARLDVSPDGRLYVTYAACGGSDSGSMLLALDPDGRVSR